ncbi:HAD family hydrolase [Chloroflexota bacterium]
MKYKLLVEDVDGTLLDGKGEISGEDKDALARACRSGVQISLSSGRVLQACLGIIDKLSLDGYHIFFDGALVSDPGQDRELCVKPLSKDLVKQAVEFAH